MKLSAGILLYRSGPQGLEVLLVHPSGNYNRKAPWGIPKGELDQGEEPLAAARRELLEEVGLEATEHLTPLGDVAYRSGKKRVLCFAGPGSPDFPRCASWEIDQARYVPIDQAQEIMHPDQREFLARLMERLKTGER